MSEIVIRDVPIKFPFEPYKVQEDYMTKVLECLQQGVNGVLESPTGTGKTLSLLCSSLAWQQTKKAQAQANAQTVLINNEGQKDFNNSLQFELQKCTGAPKSSESGSWSKGLATPMIIYASRTHSQLTQAINELKRTQYSYVSSCVLGSRDQLCLHPDLVEDHGFMKIAMCRAKVKGKSCHYYNNLDSKRYSKDFLPKQVGDIEDLVKFGQKSQCCPYFMTRLMLDSADIVFTPYNYLLSSQTRRQQGLDLCNSVVILDEAHNIERICEDYASVQISSTDIAMCISEVSEVMKKYKESMEKEFADVESPPDFSEEDLCLLKTMFLLLEKAIDEIKLDPEKENMSKKNSGKKFPGSFIFEILSKAEVHATNAQVINTALTSLVEYLSTASDVGFSRKGGHLESFNEFINVVFGSCGKIGEQTQTDLFYRVYVEPEQPKKRKQDLWSNNKTKVVTKSSAKVVNFWCFSPGFTMRSLLQQGVHSVILTSGTLSPLDATISELGIPIPVQLENPHIIKPNQLNVSVISKGPTREQLTSTFNNRDNVKYLADLGSTITNFCRVVPGGVLVFFPSFLCMEKTVTYWQQEGVWSKMNDIKTVFVEPQRSASLSDVMRNFSVVLEAEGSRGAVFMAVMRGKVSEGMDFADTKCRAVFITGLPYPPYMDPRIVMKQEYIDNLRKTNPNGITGRYWYELEATRAVNQAIGRVIRHANDFGAIILCDSRFESPKVINALSAWLRPHIIKCPEFGPAFGRVTKFFKEMGGNVRKQMVQSGASFDYADVKVRLKEAKEDKTLKRNSDSSMKNFLEKFRLSQPTASPQPSPQGLLDALNVSSNQNKGVDILRTVYGQTDEVSESYVQPAPKKRKLRIIPLQFDNETTCTISTAGEVNGVASTSSQKTFIEPILQEANSFASISHKVSCLGSTSKQINCIASTSQQVNCLASTSNQFNCSTSTSDQANEVNERTKTTKEYLEEVKNRLSTENYAVWKDCVKTYNKDAVYYKIMFGLRKVFPDERTMDLFIGFKRFMKPQHLKEFQIVCRRLYGRSS